MALLLGRLRLSVPVAIDIFARMSKEIFSEQKWSLTRLSDGKFKATNLEASVKKVLRENDYDENAELLVHGLNPCKTSVSFTIGDEINAQSD